MIKHSEEKQVNFSVSQVYDLIIDVEKYPLFVPYCVDARIYNQKENSFYADMFVGNGFIKEKFTTKASLEKDDDHAIIEVDYVKGPFKKLYSKWVINKIDEQSSKISFVIKLELKSFIMQKALNKVFESYAKKTVSAFIERAKEVYS